MIPEKVKPTLSVIKEIPIVKMDDAEQRNFEQSRQNSLTDADATAFATASPPGGTYLTDANTVVLDNMRTRISEIETVLYKLGFIKK